MAISLKLVFGSNVRFYRKRLRLTQFQLAEIINCSPSFIGFIENGKSSVSFQTIEALTDALRVSAAQLFSADTNSENNFEVQEAPGEYSPDAARIVSDLEILIDKYRKHAKLPNRRRYSVPHK